jgi:ABC-type sugar transport system ATPase subunit
MASSDNIILEVKNISKYFGNIMALNNVSFSLQKNEILGLVGDNGAGKSTLIKIISGVYQKNSGEIYFDGSKVEINSPTDAIGIGIETVYQDLALVDELDVSANIFLGREQTRWGKFGKKVGVLNFKKMYNESFDLIGKLKSNIPNLKKSVRYLSGGQRQAVAISKVVFWGKKVVILDEPTAALGVKESENVLNLIKSLKDHGVSVIAVSHNLQHVFKIVDRIMILRLGEVVGILNTHETEADEVVSMITGAKFIKKV